MSGTNTHKSTDYEQIRVDRDGPIARVTLERPDALNAITPTMLAGFRK